MTRYILDASVAAKWFLPMESFADEAAWIREQFTAGRARLTVPDVFWPELGNVLWKGVRLGRMSMESANQAVHLCPRLGIPTLPSLPLLSDAFAIAVHFRRAIYDCIYVALAVTSGSLLVTADERLANAVAAHFPVRWLDSMA